jgi:hypothetical protein
MLGVNWSMRVYVTPSVHVNAIRNEATFVFDELAATTQGILNHVVEGICDNILGMGYIEANLCLCPLKMVSTPSDWGEPATLYA